MKKIFFTVIFYLSMLCVWSQQYTGRIYDLDSKQPLPYVNIGIINKSVGTVAQGDGSFTITIADMYNADSVRVSMVGYVSQTFLVNDFIHINSEKIVIYLKADIKELSAVIVKPKSTRELILGNVYNSNFITAGFRSEQLGTELGTIMKVKKGKEYYLENCGFNLSYCGYDSITFRINIYDYANDTVGALLNTTPLYVTAIKNQKSIVFNLDSYNIFVTNDFVLSIEWIQDVKDMNTNVHFCAGFFGASSLYKNTSADSWQKAPGIGVGCWCRVVYEK